MFFIKKGNFLGPIIAGIGAGAINGLLGAGGGMVLVPVLGLLGSLDEEEIFPASVSIILPICIVSILISGAWKADTISSALPYLIGSAAGGFLAGVWGRRIPTIWLHRGLGILILWGGIRYLC